MKFAHLSRYAFVMLLGLSLVFQSCKEKKGGGAAAYVPNDGTFLVYSIDFQNLMEKADYEKIKELDFFKDALKEAARESEVAAEIMKDPTKSGLNLAQDAYFFLNFEDVKSPEDLDGFGGLVMSMSDKSQFETMLKDSEAPGFIDKGDYTMIHDKNDAEVALAWNDEIVFIGVRMSEENDDDASKLMENFFKKSTDNILKNKTWVALSAEDHDMAQMVNFDPILLGMKDEFLPQLAMFGIEESDLEGNHITAFADFKNGELYSESEYFLQPGLTKDLNMFFKDKVSTDFSKYVPKAGQTAYMTFGLDIRGIEQVLKEKGMLGLLNMQMAQMGLTAEDLSKGFGGDMMLSVHITGKDDGYAVFGMDVKDMDILNKFLALGEQVGGITKESDNQYIINNTSDAMKEFIADFGEVKADGNEDARLVIKDNMIFITDQKAIYKTILNGGFSADKQMDAAIHNDLASNLWGLNVDFETVKGMITEEMPNFNLEGMKTTTTKKISKFSMYTADKSKNILSSLVELMNQAYLSEMEKEKSYQEEEAIEEDSGSKL